MKQLGLFADAAAEPLAHLEADRRLAARLPPDVLLGPSSWTFSGWEGIVYPVGFGRDELLTKGLAEISRYPLFGTVGIDRSHYAPLDEETLRRYAAQLPPHFPCVIKVWNMITTHLDTRTNSPSHTFLDPAVCEQHVLLPLARFFEQHAGPLVFQFPPIPARHLPAPEVFAERLDRFFSVLPRAFRYAVEIRNRELLHPVYFEALARNEIAHVVNLWERMPTIRQQLALPGVFTAPFVVSRLSITQENRYEEQKKRFMPFNRLCVIEEEMRADVVSLVKAARSLKKAIYITVNNKVEGCSPLTVRALIERIVAEVSL